MSNSPMVSYTQLSPHKRDRSENKITKITIHHAAVVIAIFARLALNGAISADNVMIIASMVVSFYFDTQTKKK